MSHPNRANSQEGVDVPFCPAPEFPLPFLVSTKLAPVPHTMEKPKMGRQGLLSPYGFICVPLAQL